MAWAALPPLFYFFQMTGAATSLLAGPQVAWILSQPVPGWLPLPFVNKNEPYGKKSFRGEMDADLTVERAEATKGEVRSGVAGTAKSWIQGNKAIARLSNALGADGELTKVAAREEKETEAKTKVKGAKPLLVEDVVEQSIRRAVRTGYTLTRSIYGQAKGYGKNEDELADDALKALEGKGSRSSLHIGLGDRVRKTAETVSFREILDGAAAYVVVKVCNFDILISKSHN